MTTKTKADTNGSAASEDTPGLTARFVAKTIVLDEFSPSFGDMVDIEEAFGCSMTDFYAVVINEEGEVENRGTARAMWATGWAAIHRVLPDVTPDEVRDLGPADFAEARPKAKAKKAEDAGQAQG